MKDDLDRKFVYVISNENYPGEYKVGIALDWKRRLNSYQTSDPGRGFKIEYAVFTPLYAEIEKHVHAKFENKKEWVKANLEDIVDEIESYQKGNITTDLPVDLDTALFYCVEEIRKQDVINIVEGDCLEKLKEIPPEFVDLVVTDPPYFLDGLDTDWTKGKKDAKSGTGSVGGLPVGMKFDPQQGKDLQKFINKVGCLLMPIMKPGAFGVFFSQPRLSHRLAVGLEDAGFEIRDMMAWRYTKRAQFKAFSMNHFINRLDIPNKAKKIMKRNADNRKTPQLRPQFEAMVLVQKPRIGTFLENWNVYKTGLMDIIVSLDGKVPSTVMTVEKPVKENFNGHLTPKPSLLIEHLIKLFSVAGQVVLDPFLGSGTTAIAAMKTERSCIGIEINPDYIEISEKRLQEAGT